MAWLTLILTFAVCLESFEKSIEIMLSCFLFQGLLYKDNEQDNI